MPPKSKFTREEIIKTALDLTREKGIEAVTARELGKRLNSSSRPIFTVFTNMEEVQLEIYNEAKKLLRSYFQTSQQFSPEFKKIGMMMIQFAIDEPKLFQLLFMKEDEETKNYDQLIKGLGADLDYCILIIKRDYGLDDEMAKKLFDQLWLHAYGIGVLCATKMCSFTEKEISQMLSEVFAGMLYLIQSNNLEIKLQKSKDQGFKVTDIPVKVE